MGSKVRWFSVIRVIGLCLVLMYHFFPRVCPGGFLGVDVFFTFSGYLITSLILREIELSGNFSVFNFFKRRFLRIFPTLVVAVMFTLPFLRLLPTDFSANLDKQVTAVLGFVTNYFEIMKGASYEARLLPDVYVHTWSLALEMQLYAFCALVIYLVNAICRKFFLKKSQRSFMFHIFSLVIFFISAVFSYFCMQYLFFKNPEPSVAYFHGLSHSYPFFLGGIIAMFFGINLQKKVSTALLKRKKFLTTSSMLLAILATFFIMILAVKFNFNSKFTYNCGFIVCSLLTCVLIICFRILHETVNKDTTEPAFLSHIAEVSYPLYLFHWPLLIVFSNVIKNNLLAIAVTLIISYVLSLISMQLCKSFCFKHSACSSAKDAWRLKYAKFSGIVFVVLLILNINSLAKCPEIKEIELEQIVGSTVQSLDSIRDITAKFVAKPAVSEKSKDDTASDVKSASSQSKNDKPGSLREKKVDNSSGNSEKKDVNLNDAKVKLVGDSVSLGARKALLSSIPNSTVDTKGSRGIAAGYEIIKQWQAENPPCEYLVVALGTNGSADANKYIDRTIEGLKPGQRLVFVTPFDGRWDETWNSYKTTQYLRSLKDKYDYVTIADWAEAIGDKQNLLGADKVHIAGSATAVNLYVKTVTEALNIAKEKPAKLPEKSVRSE